MTVIKSQLQELCRYDQCEFVYNGEEAVCKYSELVLANHQVSYILTDFMMPRLNGIQAISKIKEFINDMNSKREVKIMEPKVVFLTAYKTS